MIYDFQNFIATKFKINLINTMKYLLEKKNGIFSGALTDIEFYTCVLVVYTIYRILKTWLENYFFIFICLVLVAVVTLNRLENY